MKIEQSTLPVPLNEDDFDSAVFDTSYPVLVVFGAEDVEACRPIDAFAARLAGAFDGFVKVARVDVETSPALVGRFGLQSVPTVLLFHGGRVVGRWSGALSRMEIERAMSARLPAA